MDAERSLRNFLFQQLIISILKDGKLPVEFLQNRVHKRGKHGFLIRKVAIKPAGGYACFFRYFETSPSAN
jgi:hypothetical protein